MSDPKTDDRKAQFLAAQLLDLVCTAYFGSNGRSGLSTETTFPIRLLLQTRALLFWLC